MMSGDQESESELNAGLDMKNYIDVTEELEKDWEWKTPALRILSIPRGEFNPFKHGNGFSPYTESPDFWVIQVRKNNKNDVWINIPIVQYDDA